MSSEPGRGPKPDPAIVVGAAKAWVRAHALYRFGARAYTDESQAWLDQAEADLLRAVGGSEDPVLAAEALGTKIEPRRPRKALRAPNVARKRARLPQPRPAGPVRSDRPALPKRGFFERPTGG